MCIDFLLTQHCSVIEQLLTLHSFGAMTDNIERLLKDFAPITNKQNIISTQLLSYVLKADSLKMDFSSATVHSPQSNSDISLIHQMFLAVLLTVPLRATVLTPHPSTVSQTL